MVMAMTNICIALREESSPPLIPMEALSAHPAPPCVQGLTSTIGVMFELVLEEIAWEEACHTLSI
jgi:hypothetical protein